MDIKKLVSEAFLMAIVESVKRDGPEKTIELIENVAKYIGEKEGPGLEGDPKGSVNCMYICPFANILQEFLNKYGGMPPEFEELLEYSNDRDDIAASNVFCLYHHSLRAKRAEMAGKKVSHLASNANAEAKTTYNDKAIEAANLSRENIDELITKTVCIFKYE